MVRRWKGRHWVVQHLFWVNVLILGGTTASRYMCWCCNLLTYTLLLSGVCADTVTMLYNIVSRYMCRCCNLVVYSIASSCMHWYSYLNGVVVYSIINVLISRSSLHRSLCSRSPWYNHTGWHQCNNNCVAVPIAVCIEVCVAVCVACFCLVIPSWLLSCFWFKWWHYHCMGMTISDIAFLVFRLTGWCPMYSCCHWSLKTM